MTEWSLPVEAQETFEDVVHEMEHHHRWGDMKSFVRGGYWRNFKVKYEEANEMYARMMYVSRRLAEAEKAGIGGDQLDQIRDHLYRGQCNCTYWHGAFGGIYLPHLRNAVYQHLIEADNLVERELGSTPGQVDATADDYNFDGLQEIRLSNDLLCAWFAPGPRRAHL